MMGEKPLLDQISTTHFDNNGPLGKMSFLASIYALSSQLAGILFDKLMVNNNNKK